MEALEVQTREICTLEKTDLPSTYPELMTTLSWPSDSHLSGATFTHQKDPSF